MIRTTSAQQAFTDVLRILQERDREDGSGMVLMEGTLQQLCPARGTGARSWTRTRAKQRGRYFYAAECGLCEVCVVLTRICEL